jgi:predicted ATPase
MDLFTTSRQLSLLVVLLRAADAGAQFVISTHSPILLACPGARIYGFDKTPIARVAYDELEHVTLMRDFLSDPEAYLRRLRGGV